MRANRFYKYSTWILLATMLPALLIMSTDAGISGDEYFHLNQAEAVVNWYTTMGSDTTALHTPVTNLKYYGQGFDNAASLTARIFGIEDIFTLRHLMNAFAGWLIFLFVMLLSFMLGGWRAAFFSVVLCIVSPRLIGHSFNNLKDIPFALGYTAGLYYLLRWIREFPAVSRKTMLAMALVIAFTISIRPPGLILIVYLVMVTSLLMLRKHFFDRQNAVFHHPIWIKLFIVVVVGYFLGLLFWPYALLNPIKHPVVSHFLMEAYPVTIRQLFMGELIWSDRLPWYYLPWMMIISVPLIVWLGMLGFFFSGFWKTSKKRMFFGTVLFATFFPLVYIILKESNVYGGWRHVLFIYPLILVISAIGLHRLWQYLTVKNHLLLKVFTAAVLIFLMVHPVKFMVKNHPFQYLYFNQIVGGYQGAFGKYEADYYFHTIRHAAEWLNNYVSEKDEEGLIIASNFEAAWFFKENERIAAHRQTSWYNRSFQKWDYAIFSATYLHSFSLKPDLWPPPETIYTVFVEGKPVCVVLKRSTDNDYKGWKALREGDLSRADSLLYNAVTTSPHLEGAWLNLGRVRYQLGSYHDAINALESALEIHPSFEPVLLEYARCCFEIGDIDMALNLLDRLLKYNIKYLSAYTQKAEYLVHLGRIDEALETIQACLKIQPSWQPARKMFLELVEY